jgi:hypothetical protein
MNSTIDLWILIGGGVPNFYYFKNIGNNKLGFKIKDNFIFFNIVLPML